LSGQAGLSAEFFFCCLVLVVLVVGVGLRTHGAPVQRAFPWDTPIMLDGGWRVFQGQIPYVDFHSPLGPVVFLVVALGMCLAGPCVGAIACGNAILFFIISVWAWGLSRNRMAPAERLLFVLYVGFMVAGTSVYGWRFIDTGYAAIFNRYGVAFTALILLEAFTPIGKPLGRWESLMGGVSSGTLLILLFFLKLNFFGIAALAIIAASGVMSYDRSRWIGLGLGISLVAGLMLAYLRFDMVALKEGLALTIAARSGRLWREAPMMLMNLPLAPICMLLILWWITPASDRANHARVGRKIQQAILVGYVLLAQYVLFCTCTQPMVPSLFPFAAILLLQARNKHESDNDGLRISGAVPATCAGTAWQASDLLAAYLIASVLLPDVASIIYSTGRDRSATPKFRFASASMADMIVTRHPQYVAEVNDGFNLLRQHSNSSDRVFTLGFTNPFSFGLLRPSPKGDAVWWDANTTFAASAHPDPRKVFAEVAVVMVPKNAASDPTFTLLMQIYGRALAEHFAPLAESEYWKLYRRKK